MLRSVDVYDMICTCISCNVNKKKPVYMFYNVSHTHASCNIQIFETWLA